MAKAAVKKTAKPRKKTVVKEVDPNVRKALRRRYGIKQQGRRGGRYATPKEIMDKPEAWDGDVSDMFEPEIIEDGE